MVGGTKVSNSNSQLVSIKSKLIRLLARREHSQFELRRKLLAKGFDDVALINQVLADLVEDGFQSDARFAKSYIRMRQLRGYGPRKVGTELRERGVAESLIGQYLDPEGEGWREALQEVWQRKFGCYPKDDAAYGKQVRSLTTRGFPTAWICQLLKKV